ncbi:hypothetical protein [Antrihabitans spumae]|uniref:DUF8020 domain-containing protein n=1 Tax=Antrihabitans spumae TaxID=3373370 RepID=A0ABW7K850_9NOCA
MNIRKLAAAAVLLTAATGISAGTAYAAPAPAPGQEAPLSIDIAPSVNYTAYQNGASAVITIDNAGKLIVANGNFEIRSNSGQTLAGVPLEYSIDDIAFPIDASIDGNTATLTPSTDPARAYYKPVALPFENQAPWKTPYEREVAAWTRLTQTITLGTGIGAISGAVIGGAAGCIVGGAVAAPTAVLTAVFGPLAGCVAGALVLAPVGALGGAIFVGAPVAIAAAIQYFSTINAPFTPPAEPKK